MVLWRLRSTEYVQLPSACFRLYYDAAAREPVAFRENGGEYLACALGCGHTRHTYILRTAEDGYVRMAGLPAGTYYLQESRPPSGYCCAADMLPENKTLTFYRRGCGVMAMLFTTVLCGKRRYW